MTTAKVELLSAWSQRSRDYLARVKTEAPDHAEEWKLLDNLDLIGAPYKPHHTITSDGISEYHRHIEAAPGGCLGIPFLINLGVEGYLHKAEALKLYEMGYHAKGDILELGTHKGLSTSILAHALEDHGSGNLVTVDVDKETNKIARKNLKRRPGVKRVSFMLVDAKEAMDGLIASHRRFSFIFVDHWHGYDATYDAAVRASVLLSAGGYVMFHDFFDVSNRDPDHVYGVYPAVLDVFGNDPTVIFCGAAGSSALFQKLR